MFLFAALYSCDCILHIEGVVIDAETQLPLANVKIEDTKNSHTFYTDSLGRFYYSILEGCVFNPAKALYSFEKEGYITIHREYESTHGDSLVIALKKQPLSSSQLHTTDLEKKSVQRALLKEYFLCVAIHEGFKAQQLDTADCSLAVYFDILRYPPEVFEKIQAYAKQMVASMQPSPITDLGYRKAILLDCMEMYKSKELDQFIRAMDEYFLE